MRRSAAANTWVPDQDNSDYVSLVCQLTLLGPDRTLIEREFWGEVTWLAISKRHEPNESIHAPVLYAELDHESFSSVSLNLVRRGHILTWNPARRQFPDRFNFIPEAPCLYRVST